MLTMENATVDVVNNLGQLIASNNSKGLNGSFKISGARGLYFVKVISGSQLLTAKVIVE